MPIAAHEKTAAQAATGTPADRAAKPPPVFTPMEVPTGRSRRYCLWFLALSATGVVPILAMNALVDPHNLLGVRIFAPLIWSAREQKLHILANGPSPPAAWILGSSRSMMISPAELTALTGLSAVNMSVDSCRTECCWVLTQLAVKARREPKIILLGLDVEALHNRAPVDHRWGRIAEARALLPELRKPLVKAFFDNLAQLLSYDMTVGSLAVLKHRWYPPRTPPSVEFREDGTIRYPLREMRQAAGSFDLEAEIKMSLAEYRGRFAGFEELSSRRQQYLEQFLDLCRERRIGVAIWITPLHPMVAQELAAGTSYVRLKAELWAYLKRLQAVYGFDLHDFSDPQYFAGREQDFWDGAHMNEANGKRLLAKLVAESPHLFTGQAK
jgi:hypothetical protein